jgi:hypothetical protein
MVKLFQKPTPAKIGTGEADSYLDTPEYAAFVEECSKICRCAPELRPCDGCLAGGMCDEFGDEIW